LIGQPRQALTEPLIARVRAPVSLISYPTRVMLGTHQLTNSDFSW